MKKLAISLFLIMLAIAVWNPINNYFKAQREESRKIEIAQAQVQALIQKVDSENKEEVYEKYRYGYTAGNDPWGTPISIVVEIDGKTVMIEARAAGKDKSFFTDDDFIRNKIMNLK